MLEPTKAVHDTEGSGFGVKRAIGCAKTVRRERDVPALELTVQEQGKMSCNVDLKADARRNDVRCALDVLKVLRRNNEAPILIVQLAAAKQEIGIGANRAEPLLDAQARRKTFFPNDGSAVDRVGSPDLQGRKEPVEWVKTQVKTRSKTQISRSLQASIRTGQAKKDRRLKSAAGCGDTLACSSDRLQGCQGKQDSGQTMDETRTFQTNSLHAPPAYDG